MANDSGGGGAFLVVLAFIGIYSCSRDEPEEQQLVAELGISEDEASELIATYGNADVAMEAYAEEYEYAPYSSGAYGGDEPERAAFDEQAARAEAEDDLASEGYDGSYGCTVDCSGHDAGWQWRAENGYSTYGNSNSFSEGGQAFDDALDERVDDMRNDYENGMDTGY